MFDLAPNRSSDMSPSLPSIILAGCLCVLLAVASADSVILLYKKVGDDVVIKPGPFSGAIDTIVWRHGNNIAVQWVGKELDPFVRCELNITSGEMTITGLTPNYTGLYKPEINAMDLNPTHLIVISSVPKPTVGKSCDAARTSCNLTCEGDTTGAEPFTYRWKSGSDVTGSSKEQRITKDNSSRTDKFSCELENPVSQMSSDPISNPFFESDQPEREPNIPKGLVVFVVLLFVVLLVVGIHRCKAGMWFFQKASMPWQADFWQNPGRTSGDPVSNGSIAQEKGQKDEETPMT
ncbi:uncharacterized protein LOC117939132 [Etheostoma cragini]|uniref:uncharacterized protein LOC117939132 n=1 Tax=Etheostoma cragini TaxID=417921 RepID=UPI00155EB16C|nr:uncharacterized protein LOC117939132 [Etheostoma cragini]